MEESEFILGSVRMMYYNTSYIDSPNWIKKKKATTNPKK